MTTDNPDPIHQAFLRRRALKVLETVARRSTQALQPDKPVKDILRESVSIMTTTTAILQQGKKPK